MNCTDFEAHINQFVDGTLNDKLCDDMLKHRQQCGDCEASLEEHKAYRATLAGWQEPHLSAATKARLLASLDKTSTQKPAHTLSGFASGFAAASFLAVAFFVSGQLFSAKPETLSQDQVFALVEDENHLSQEITIVINAPIDMPNAELQLALPSELSVVGQEHLAHVRMPVNLKQGQNEIVIPVQLEEFALYADNIVVDASLIYNNSKKDFALDLDEHLDSESPQIDGDELIQHPLNTNTNKTV